MSKDQNAYAKRAREMAKKQKADAKRHRRQKKNEGTSQIDSTVTAETADNDQQATDDETRRVNKPSE